MQTNVPARATGTADEALRELKRLDISKDKEYYAAPRRRGAGAGRSVHHCKFAQQLSTIPMQLSFEDMRTWHRPRGRWWAAQPGAERASLGVAPVILVALTGLYWKPGKWEINVKNQEPRVWLQQVFDNKHSTFRAGKGKRVQLLVPSTPPRELPMDKMLSESGPFVVEPKQVPIAIVFPQATLLPTSKAEALPDESEPAMLRAPLAFPTKKYISAVQTSGRVILVEYMEESPMLLNRPGMGARLSTYYRRRDAADATPTALREEAIAKDERWKVGAMLPLGKDDDTRLFLGELPVGNPQLAVETGLFTAPACSYNAAHADFLLVRERTGLMTVREITGTVATGQLLPNHRIPAPGARGLKDLEERRMYAYVFRQLRAEQSKLDGEGEGKRATVSLTHLSSMFNDRPENMIRMYLKNECGLVMLGRSANGEFYGLPEAARLPSEVEIRKKVRRKEGWWVGSGVGLALSRQL